MNRVYFDVDFLMQPSRFAGATVFFNTIGETAGKASIKILGAPHSRRCFLKNVCFSVQNPVEMGSIVSKSRLKSARLIFCIVIRRELTGYFYADSNFGALFARDTRPAPAKARLKAHWCMARRQTPLA